MSFLRDSYAALGGAVVPPLFGASLPAHTSASAHARSHGRPKEAAVYGCAEALTAGLEPVLFLALCSETLGLDKWKTQRCLERIEAGYPSNPYRTH